MVAMIAAAATLGTAALAWLTAAQARTATAQARTEKRLASLTQENRALWRYTRHLIDWGYRTGTGPPPEPPEEIKNLYQFGDT